MENNRDNLVLILAGCAGRPDRAFGSTPGLRTRVAHRTASFGCVAAKPHRQTLQGLDAQGGFVPNKATHASTGSIPARCGLPPLTRACPIRTAPAGVRLSQANRLFSVNAGPRDDAVLARTGNGDIRAGRVFQAGLDGVCSGSAT